MKLETVRYGRGRSRIESAFYGNEIQVKSYMLKRYRFNPVEVNDIYDDLYINEPRYIKFYHHNELNKIRLFSMGVN